jgi:hypothetical protein
MSRFVFVSFAFLGWGFYELSGGADFTPPERPVTEIAEAPTPVTNRGSQNGITVSATSLVTRTMIEARHKDLVRARVEERQSPPVLAPQDQDGEAHEAAPPASASLFTAGLRAGGLQLASLEAGLGGGLQSDWREDDAPIAAIRQPGLAEDTAAGQSPAAENDIRSIRASRVNMRQGPGTAYPIITRLLAGDEVIVIDDNGSGWLHLRTTDDEHFGWIAASLVSKKAP